MLQIRQGSLKNVFEEYQNIVLFGAGTLTTAMFEAYKESAFEKKVDYILDNDKSKDGKMIQVNGKEIQLISVKCFSKLGLENYALIIMPVFMLDIVKQIDNLPVFNDVPTYIYAFLMNRREEVPFMRQAHEARRWAYVTDYARKDILYHYGGIYFDTDVELVRSFEDLLYNDFFVGRDDVVNINSGSGIGAVKGNPLMKALRDDYGSRMFTDENGKIIAKACGVYETALLGAFR